MSDGRRDSPVFPSEFDDAFAVGPDEGNHAYFGRNVLRGLIEGIEEFVRLRQPRWEQIRSDGPVLLGSAMWINDPELLDKLDSLAGALIIVRKQSRKPWKVEELRRLEERNKRMPGLPARAFADLAGLAPKVGGEPPIVARYDRIDNYTVPAIRTIGYRSRGDSPPIIHAKLALLGHLWWHDEGAPGHVEDVIGFTAKRLWISSANFTESSRQSLEFGYWTEDPALLAGAERFLVKLMRSSEGLDPDSDLFEPDFAPVEFDDEAFAEVMAEMRWTDEDDDE